METRDWALATETVLVVRVSGTAESTVETVKRMQGRVGKTASGELHEDPIRALLFLQDRLYPSFRI